MTTKQDIAEGARNILINCADLDAGDSLVIIHEQPDLGWYDREAPLALAAEAREMGLATTLLEVGEPSNDREPRVVAAMAAHDCTIFFARIGDQDRFAEPRDGKKVVMIYIRDIEMLASPYGRGHHHAFIELKKSVNAVLVGTERIEITCSLGTSLSGGVSGQSDDEGRCRCAALSTWRTATRRRCGFFRISRPRPIPDADGFKSLRSAVGRH
jgi:hypothetical protein